MPPSEDNNYEVWDETTFRLRSERFGLTTFTITNDVEENNWALWDFRQQHGEEAFQTLATGIRVHLPDTYSYFERTGNLRWIRIIHHRTPPRPRFSASH